MLVPTFLPLLVHSPLVYQLPNLCVVILGLGLCILFQLLLLRLELLYQLVVVYFVHHRLLKGRLKYQH